MGLLWLSCRMSLHWDLCYFLLYWACYRSVVIQNYLLILAGLLFLLSWQWQFVFSVLFVWFVSHISVIFFKKYPQKRKKILLISVALLLAQLCFFKYTNFTIEQLNDSILKENNLNPLDIVMPLGISFYTFQAISYVVDVYKQKITPLPSKILLGFLSFVPTITAGPIFRASHAKEQWIADNPNSADIAKQRLVKEISENLAENSGKKLSKGTKNNLLIHNRLRQKSHAPVRCYCLIWRLRWYLLRCLKKLY